MIEFIKTFQEHNITLHPAGIWEMKTIVDSGTTTKKKNAVDAIRKHNLAWAEYPNDNMAKHQLTESSLLLVVDIDGEPITKNYTDGSHYIPSLELTLPATLYSTTTQLTKHHFYYSIPSPHRARAIGVAQTKVDMFTYGTVFEAHTFSSASQVHNHPIAPATQEMLDILLHSPTTTSHTNSRTPTTNIQRYNLVRMFLADELLSQKQWNAFFRSIMPQDDTPKHANKLTIKHYPMSYDLVNKIAVKLTLTAELDHYTHTIPTLYKLITMWGRNPQSTTSQSILFKNILPSLPEHKSIMPYSIDYDTMTIQEHLDAQEDTPYPIFRVLDGTVRYIEVDKVTQAPLPHNGAFFLDQNSAQSLHPERNITTEDGKVIGWDSNVPILYYMNDPYMPQYVFDMDYYRHTINLYTQSRYIKQAEQSTSVDNVVSRIVASTVGPKWLPYVHAFHAHVLFGKVSLNMVLWVASLPTMIGGSGKSIITTELLSIIAGGCIQSINEKTAMSGWGDVVASSRLISLEDMTDLGKKEWDQVYAMIKQQTSNSYRKLNMKGASMDTKRVSVSISGSSNHRPMLPPSDRRFLCLEPAHLHGVTEPVSAEDSKHMSQLLRSRDHQDEIQEYVNYLYYVYHQELSDEMREALFERSPQTEYRHKWVSEGATNTQNIIHALPYANELIELMRIDEMNRLHIGDMIELICLAYRSDTQKSAVSWKWFSEVLPYIVSERYKDREYSKASLAHMLEIDFKNVGSIYSNAWRTLPDNRANMPHEGYVFKLEEDQYREYRAILDELRSKVDDINL
jgi:hypothetical protein